MCYLAVTLTLSTGSYFPTFSSSAVSSAALDVMSTKLTGKSIDDHHGQSGKTKYDITGYDVHVLKLKEHSLEGIEQDNKSQKISTTCRMST